MIFCSVHADSASISFEMASEELLMRFFLESFIDLVSEVLICHVTVT